MPQPQWSKKMSIKLIALDIDGTTLMSDGSLSQRNREALVRATDSGIHVVIALQRADATILSGFMRSNVAARVAVGSLDPKEIETHHADAP